MQAYIVVDKEPWMNVVSSVYAFRCKRFPDGSIRKLRKVFVQVALNMKEGINYFETFVAPVV